MYHDRYDQCYNAGYDDYVNNHSKYYNLHWNNDIPCKDGYDDGWNAAHTAQT